MLSGRPFHHLNTCPNAKAEENLAFRRYLSAQHYADKPFQILVSQVQQHMDCTNCANCRPHSLVSVNTPEIENIARHLGARGPPRAGHAPPAP